MSDRFKGTAIAKSQPPCGANATVSWRFVGSDCQLLIEQVDRSYMPEGLGEKNKHCKETNCKKLGGVRSTPRSTPIHTHPSCRSTLIQLHTRPDVAGRIAGRIAAPRPRCSDRDGVGHDDRDVQLRNRRWRGVGEVRCGAGGVGYHWTW